MKGIITVARDILGPLFFNGWNNEKQIEQDSTTGELGWINMDTAGLMATKVTPSNYVAQIAANKGPVHSSIGLISKKVGASALRIYRPVAKSSKSILYETRTRAVPEPRRTELLGKAAPGSVLSLADNVEEIVGGHRLIDVLTVVNAFYDAYQLKFITAAYLELTGNCYWVLLKDNLGIPVAIWIAPAEYMRVKPDKNMFVAGYVYKRGSLTKTFAPDEVVHFKMPAPGAQFQFYGRGDLMGAADDVNLLQHIYQFEEAIFSNGGVPATVLSTDTNWTEEQKESFREQFLQRYGGSKKAGKPMVVENVKIEQLGLNPKEMAYQGSRLHLKDDIASNMGIPPAMLSNKINSRMALDASMTQIEIFSIDPMLRLIQQALNAQMIPLYKDPIYVEFDDPVSKDKEFELKQDTEFVDNGIATINEVRKKRGLEPLEGGDVAYINMNKIPLGTEVSRQPTQAQISDMASKALAEAKSRMWGNE